MIIFIIWKGTQIGVRGGILRKSSQRKTSGARYDAFLNEDRSGKAKNRVDMKRRGKWIDSGVIC